MKTDKISFGTNPRIGEMSANIALPKYSNKLTEGIIDAFTKLAKNDINDELIINIGRKRDAIRPTTDVLELSYWAKKPDSGSESTFISSTSFSPKTLSKMTTKSISELILKTYEGLKNSPKKTNLVAYYPQASKTKTTAFQQERINVLLDKFGFDDFTVS